MGLSIDSPFTPIFKIEVNGGNITELVKKRLMQLSLTDNSGFESDRFTMTLDDSDNKIELPKTGAKIKVSLGYKETALEEMGEYVVEGIELNGAPHTITINANSVDLLKEMKAPVTKAWQHEGKPGPKIKLSEIVESIAGKHSLQPKVGEEFKEIAYQVVNQHNESDMNLMTRLGKSLDAVAKISQGYLLFVKKGKAKSATGKNLAELTIEPKQCINWNVSIGERAHYKCVKAKYRSTPAGLIPETSIAKVGSGTPEFTIREIQNSQTLAKKAAQAKLDELNRGKSKLSLTTLGDPKYLAECKLKLEKFRGGIKGDWTITSVSHTLSSSGYLCSIKAEKPTDEAK